MLDSTLATLLNEDRHDGFFVKNIENVQGDERDAIFLSIGYGKWEDGKARMLFGPINRTGGGRRLNVAITRAREHVTVVSSLLPEEIRLADTASEGAHLLQAYLSYARSSAQAAISDHTDSDDIFVESVAYALEAQGHKIQRQVGLSDYRVDLAVCDPKDPDRFLLGIECDSDNYKSGETVRAREWLRADVLKNLGWRLYRLWSADWIRDPAKALENIERAIAGDEIVEASVLVQDNSDSAVQQEEEPLAVQDTPSADKVADAGGLLPGLSYFTYADNLTFPGGTEALYGNPIACAEFVYALTRAEGPIAVSMIATRLCRAAGLTRTGRQIQRITEQAISLLTAANRVEVKGTFIWLEDMKEPPARVPYPGREPRAIDQIAPEELERIVYIVLRNGIGMRLEELVTETARVLGYGATGSAIREYIASAISRLEYDNQIHNFNGQLRTFEIDKTPS
jgi:very-short-patch-repair endonuclease